MGLKKLRSISKASGMAEIPEYRALVVASDEKTGEPISRSLILASTHYIHD
jgi:hypothetical protein